MEPALGWQGGRDHLAGNAGADTLYGGTGPDDFEFFWVDDSGPLGSGSTDIIGDFRAFEGDFIELSVLDANSEVTGNQAFSLGNAGFSGAPGEINYTYSGGDRNPVTMIASSTSGSLSVWS